MADIADLSSLQIARCKNLFTVHETIRALDGDMPVVQLSVLFFVALHPEVTQREIITRLGLPSSTASRSISALSHINTPRRKGLGLITWREDELDRRVKRLSLSTKGRALMERLAGTV